MQRSGEAKWDSTNIMLSAMTTLTHQTAPPILSLGVCDCTQLPDS